MAEAVFTCVTRVPADRLAQVERVLQAIDQNRSLLSLHEVRTLHFASLVLFNQDDRTADPVLVFESNIDKPIKGYLTELVKVGRRGLDALYTACDQTYPGAAAPDADVVRYLLRLKKDGQLYHVGHPNRSVQEIRADCELRRSIAAELERMRAQGELNNLSPAHIVRRIRVKANCPSPFWPRLRPWHADWDNPAIRPGSAPTPLNEIEWVPDQWRWGWLWRSLWLWTIAWLLGVALVVALEHYLDVPRRATIVSASLVVFGIIRKGSADARILRALTIAGLFGALVWAPFRLSAESNPPAYVPITALVILSPALFFLITYLHVGYTLALNAPAPRAPTLPVGRLQALVDAEDRVDEHSIYNHVAGLCVFREGLGPIRRLRTRLVLFVLNLFYRTQFVKGKLVSIASIHFAQWRLLGNQLLFLTNYDGAADSYLDDFFNSLADGVALIWHDTKLFPRTTDPRRLKLWVREGQTLASLRYRASVYEGLTVGAINSNTYIRERLLRGRGERSARRWLRRFATTPEEPSIFVRLAGWLKDLAGVTG